MSDKIRAQHYVWRYHLEAWLQKESTTVACFRQGKVFETNPRNIAQERDFYRLNLLSHQDILFIKRVFIDASPPALQATHLNLIHLMQTVANLNDSLQKNTTTDPATKAMADRLTNNAEEMLHGFIEESAIDYLDLLRKGDISFYLDDEASALFLNFLATQYFRTKKMRENVQNEFRHETDVLNRIWNLVSHILSMNLGCSLYQKRHLHQFIVLENNTEIPFITADQPAINAHHSSSEGLTLYYPISPKRALLLNTDKTSFIRTSRDVTVEGVRHYNTQMIKNSYDTIFSNSKELLSRLAGI